MHLKKESQLKENAKETERELSESTTNGRLCRLKQDRRHTTRSIGKNERRTHADTTTLTKLYDIVKSNPSCPA